MESTLPPSTSGASPGPAASRPGVDRLVIVGTDTDVGKTVVSALVVQGLGAHYWKPVQSGLEGPTDSERLQQLIALPAERLLPEAYRLSAPVSPHWAAERDGVTIDPQRLQLPDPARLPGPLVVETAGGLLVPLRRDWLQIELLASWGLPLLLVARSGLGTLNHTLLSLEALNRRAIPVLGLVLNGPLHADNPRTLEQIGGVPVLLQLPTLERLDAAALAGQWQGSALAHRLSRSQLAP
ncbi:MAG: dethiobiotin synthase [Cyanobium sp.]